MLVVLDYTQNENTRGVFLNTCKITKLLYKSFDLSYTFRQIRGEIFLNSHLLNIAFDGNKMGSAGRQSKRTERLLEKEDKRRRSRMRSVV